jgi:hypothetical protein
MLSDDGSYPLETTDTSPMLAVTWLWDRIYSSELSNAYHPSPTTEHLLETHVVPLLIKLVPKLECSVRENVRSLPSAE